MKFIHTFMGNKLILIFCNKLLRKLQRYKKMTARNPFGAYDFNGILNKRKFMGKK